jgi:hypothetical protein
VFWPNKHQNRNYGLGQVTTTHTPPSSLTTPLSNTYTPYQHISNISAATHALVSALTTLKQRHLSAQKHSKEQPAGDEKETWSPSLPSSKSHSIVFLCVSSIHPTLEPSLTSIPSLPNSSPPKAILATQTPPPDKGEKMWESLRRAIFSSFPLFSLVVTIYNWIAYFF